MYYAIIVDDEAPSRDELKYSINNQSGIKIIAECDNGISALEMIRKHQPDIIFLDIQMPGKSGVEIAKELLNDDHIPVIIFVTAYDNYAINAFDVCATDYLLKPIEPERLQAALKKAFDKLENKLSTSKYINKLNLLINKLRNKYISQDKMITVHKGGKYFPVKSSKVIYIKVEGKYTSIITENGQFILHYTLSDIQSIFNKTPFFKCHRSYIINTNYIESIDPWFNSTYQLKMRNINETIPVSRGRVKMFRQMMHIV